MIGQHSNGALLSSRQMFPDNIVEACFSKVRIPFSYSSLRYDCILNIPVTFPISCMLVYNRQLYYIQTVNTSVMFPINCSQVYYIRILIISVMLPISCKVYYIIIQNTSKTAMCSTMSGKHKW